MSDLTPPPQTPPRPDAGPTVEIVVPPPQPPDELDEAAHELGDDG